LSTGSPVLPFERSQTRKESVQIGHSARIKTDAEGNVKGEDGEKIGTLYTGQLIYFAVVYPLSPWMESNLLLLAVPQSGRTRVVLL
jgi:hypothetical protein